MEYYNGTGVLKTPELNITKSAMALLITADQAFDAFTNEKINCYIEKKDSNVVISPNIPLKDIAPVSMHGVSAIIQTGGASPVTQFLILLGAGAVKLGENEAIKVVIDGLKSAQTYKVSTIESPHMVENPFLYERKTVGSDETIRDFDVTGFGLANITGFGQVTEAHFTYANGVTVKMLPEELKAYARFNDPQAIYVDGTASHEPTDSVIMELQDVVTLQIQKNTGSAVNVTVIRQG